MREKGQTTVEFGIVAGLLLLVLFAVIDLALLFYVNLTMQYAVSEGARYAVTGNSDLGTDRRSALIEKIRECSHGLYDQNQHDPKDPTISVVDDPVQIAYIGYSSNKVSGDPGKPGQIFIVSLTYSWRLLTPLIRPFFPNGEYTFTVKSTMRNEQFPTTP